MGKWGVSECTGHAGAGRPRSCQRGSPSVLFLLFSALECVKWHAQVTVASSSGRAPFSPILFSLPFKYHPTAKHDTSIPAIPSTKLPQNSDSEMVENMEMQEGERAGQKSLLARTREREREG